MISHFNDIIRYAHSTGFENIMLMIKDDGSAGFTGMSKDRSLNLTAKFKQPLNEISDNKIGMTRLDVLAAFLRSPAFNGEGDSKADISIFRREKDNIPMEVHLKSPYGHTGVYRFMSPTVAKTRITIARTSASISETDIIFKPTEKFVKDFQSFAGVLGKFNSQFSLEVIGTTLYMNLGQDDTARIPVTEIEEDKTINSTYTWSIDNMLKVLKQAPSLDCVTVGVSEEYGMIEVSIETETCDVKYKLLHN